MTATATDFVQGFLAEWTAWELAYWAERRAPEYVAGDPEYVFQTTSKFRKSLFELLEPRLSPGLMQSHGGPALEALCVGKPPIHAQRILSCELVPSKTAEQKVAIVVHRGDGGMAFEYGKYLVTIRDSKRSIAGFYVSSDGVKWRTCRAL